MMGRLARLVLVSLAVAVAVLPARALADEQSPVTVICAHEKVGTDKHEEFLVEGKSSLSDALEFAVSQATSMIYRKDGEFVAPTVVLEQDVVIQDQLDVSGYNKKITIDLNGHCLRRDTGNKKVKNGGLFIVRKGTRLIIKDSNPTSYGYRGIRGGVITGGASTNGGGAFTLINGGALEIQGGTIYKCITDDHGGAIKLEGEGLYQPDFRMTGGRIYFCQTVGAWSNCHGGAIYANYAKVDVRNAKFDSCYSEDNGGAIYLENGTFSLDGVTFSGNHCADLGGAVYIDQPDGQNVQVEDIVVDVDNRVYIDNCRFSNNEAKDDGGALYVDDCVFCMIRGSVFNKNRAYGDGGAIYANANNCYLVNTDVIANSAKGDGGGVYVDSLCDVALKGRVRIYGNVGSDSHLNLTLQDGYASRAYAYVGGLYEGTRVGLSSTSKNVRMAYGVSAEDLDYFFSDAGGHLRVDNEYAVGTAFYSSSVFGDGQGTYLVLGAGLALASGVAVYTLATKLSKNREARS